MCRQSGKETEGWPIKTHLILIVQPTAAADSLRVYWLSAAQSLRSQAKKVPHKSVSWPPHPPLSPGTSPAPLTTCWWWQADQTIKRLGHGTTALVGQLVRREMQGLTGDQRCHAGLQTDTTLFYMVDMAGKNCVQSTFPTWLSWWRRVWKESSATWVGVHLPQTPLFCLPQLRCCWNLTATLPLTDICDITMIARTDRRKLPQSLPIMWC